jgi:hypothetical protein
MQCSCRLLTFHTTRSNFAVYISLARLPFCKFAAHTFCAHAVLLKTEHFGPASIFHSVANMSCLMPRPAVVPQPAALVRTPHAHWEARGWWRRPVTAHAQANTLQHHELGLVLEADTVVVDMHDAVHRPAFNRAFESLGLSGAKWSSRIYYDIRCEGYADCLLCSTPSVLQRCDIHHC